MSKIVDYFYSKRDNMFLFAAALAISVALFAQLQSGFTQDREREVDVPLVFTNAGDELTVLQAPRTVRVLITGPQQVLDALDSSRVRAVVDLADAEPGVSRFRVEVTGPVRRGLTLSPVVGNVEVRLDAVARKEFEVQVSPIGTPSESFTFTGATVFPSTVTVSGPASILPQVKAVRAVIDLSTLSPNQTVEVELEALGDENRPVPLVNMVPPVVEVSPAVAIGLTSRKLLVTPVYTGQPAFGFRVASITVSPMQVEVTGTSAEVARVTTVNTQPVDLTNLTSTRTFRPRLVLPDGLEPVGGDEVIVIVRIERT